MKTITLSIGGMHCGACVRRVAEQLQRIPGIQVEQVNVGSARVQYDAQQTSPQAIAAAIERSGFQPALGTQDDAT